MKLTTTFKKLREASACASRYKFLREALSNVTDDEPINLLTILETNGLDDALWALQATEQNCDRVARLMAADFAEQVLPIWEKYSTTDNRPQLAIQATRDFANGLITAEQRSAAGSAAWAAAGVARDAAWSAAGSAAGDAAGAARDAAWSAAWSAASAAGSAAWAAAGVARDAAWSAAGSAAGVARDAAWSAAGSASWAAGVAWDAAGAAAQFKQSEIFINYLKEEN